MYVVTIMHTQYDHMIHHMTVTTSIIQIYTSSVTMVTIVHVTNLNYNNYYIT